MWRSLINNRLRLFLCAVFLYRSEYVGKEQSAMQKDGAHNHPPTSVVQRIIDRLTADLLQKKLQPGDRIPTEMELAEQLGVGRNSVREAIKVLTTLGVLVVRRPEGTFVSQEFSGKLLDPLLYSLLLEQTDSTDSMEELCQGVNTILLDMADRKATPEDIATLAQRFSLLKSSLRTNDAEKVLQADDSFYAAITEAAHNVFFARIAAFMRELTAKRRKESIREALSQGSQKELLAERKQFLDRIENDPFSDESDS